MSSNNSNFRWGIHGTISGDDAVDVQNQFIEYCAETGVTSKAAAHVKLWRLGLETWQANRRGAGELTDPHQATRRFLMEQIRQEEQRHAFYRRLYQHDPAAFAETCMTEFGPEDGWQEWLAEYEAVPADETLEWNLRVTAFLEQVLVDGNPHPTEEIKAKAEEVGLVRDGRQWDRLRQAASRAGYSSGSKGTWQKK